MGSEMCIRDRYKEGAEGHNKRAEQAGVDSCLSGMPYKRGGSGSY